MSRSVRLVSCLLAGMLFAACTDDFDALFENGRADASTDGDGRADATADATADAPEEDCSSPASCTCTDDDACNTSCDVDGHCNATAQDTSVLSYACEEHVDTCTVKCIGESSCDVRCDSEGTCSLSCAEKASCVLRCTDRPTDCSLSCDERQKLDCGNGVFTCNPSCP